MIYPDERIQAWSCCDNTVVLANAGYYYTKQQVDKIVDGIEGLTPNGVEELVDEKTSTKADKSEVNALAQQVTTNARAILDRYTKSEVNALLASYKSKLEADKDISEYAAMNGTTLSLNDKNIGI